MMSYNESRVLRPRLSHSLDRLYQGGCGQKRYVICYNDVIAEWERSKASGSSTFTLDEFSNCVECGTTQHQMYEYDPYEDNQYPGDSVRQVRSRSQSESYEDNETFTRCQQINELRSHSMTDLIPYNRDNSGNDTIQWLCDNVYSNQIKMNPEQLRSKQQQQQLLQQQPGYQEKRKQQPDLYVNNKEVQNNDRQNQQQLSQHYNQYQQQQQQQQPQKQQSGFRYNNQMKPVTLHNQINNNDRPNEIQDSERQYHYHQQRQQQENHKPLDHYNKDQSHQYQPDYLSSYTNDDRNRTWPGCSRSRSLDDLTYFYSIMQPEVYYQGTDRGFQGYARQPDHRFDNSSTSSLFADNNYEENLRYERELNFCNNQFNVYNNNNDIHYKNSEMPNIVRNVAYLRQKHKEDNFGARVFTITGVEKPVMGYESDYYVGDYEGSRRPKPIHAYPEAPPALEKYSQRHRYVRERVMGPGLEPGTLATPPSTKPNQPESSRSEFSSVDQSTKFSLANQEPPPYQPRGESTQVSRSNSFPKQQLQHLQQFDERNKHPNALHIPSEQRIQHPNQVMMPNKRTQESKSIPFEIGKHPYDNNQPSYRRDYNNPNNNALKKSSNLSNSDKRPEISKQRPLSFHTNPGNPRTDYGERSSVRNDSEYKTSSERNHGEQENKGSESDTSEDERQLSVAELKKKLFGNLTENQPVKKSFRIEKKPTNKPLDKPANKPVDKPANKPVDKPANKPLDKPLPRDQVKTLVSSSFSNVNASRVHSRYGTEIKNQQSSSIKTTNQCSIPSSKSTPMTIPTCLSTSEASVSSSSSIKSSSLPPSSRLSSLTSLSSTQSSFSTKSVSSLSNLQRNIQTNHSQINESFNRSIPAQDCTKSSWMYPVNKSRTSATIHSHDGASSQVSSPAINSSGSKPSPASKPSFLKGRPLTAPPPPPPLPESISSLGASQPAFSPSIDFTYKRNDIITLNESVKASNYKYSSQIQKNTDVSTLNFSTSNSLTASNISRTNRTADSSTLPSAEIKLEPNVAEVSPRAAEIAQLITGGASCSTSNLLLGLDDSEFGWIDDDDVVEHDFYPGNQFQQAGTEIVRCCLTDDDDDEDDSFSRASTWSSSTADELRGLGGRKVRFDLSSRGGDLWDSETDTGEWNTLEGIDKTEILSSAMKINKESSLSAGLVNVDKSSASPTEKVELTKPNSLIRNLHKGKLSSVTQPTTTNVASSTTIVEKLPSSQGYLSQKSNDTIKSDINKGSEKFTQLPLHEQHGNKLQTLSSNQTVQSKQSVTSQFEIGLRKGSESAQTGHCPLVSDDDVDFTNLEDVCIDDIVRVNLRDLHEHHSESRYEEKSSSVSESSAELKSGSISERNYAATMQTKDESSISNSRVASDKSRTEGNDKGRGYKSFESTSQQSCEQSSKKSCFDQSRSSKNGVEEISSSKTEETDDAKSFSSVKEGIISDGKSAVGRLEAVESLQHQQAADSEIVRMRRTPEGVESSTARNMEVSASESYDKETVTREETDKNSEPDERRWSIRELVASFEDKTEPFMRTGSFRKQNKPDEK